MLRNLTRRSRSPLPGESAIRRRLTFEQLEIRLLLSHPGQGVPGTFGNAQNSQDEVPLTSTATGAIQGRIWDDVDGNGVQETGELGLEGWTAFLDENANGLFDFGEPNTLTDSAGDYSFSGLSAGTYVVGEVLQVGWEQTFPSSTQPSEVIYVAERDTASGSGGLIEVFDFDGNRLQTFDVPEFDNGAISDIELGPGGDLFVALDLESDGFGGAGQLLHFTPTGGLLDTITLPNDSGGSFFSPFGFDVASDGTFLVAQPNANRAIHVSSSGSLIDTFALSDNPEDVAIIGTGQQFWFSRGAAGFQHGMLNLRDDDNFWIAFAGANESRLFNPALNQLATRSGNVPIDPQEGPDGSLFVTNFGSRTLQKFAADGTNLGTVATLGIPIGLAVAGGDVPRSFGTSSPSAGQQSSDAAAAGEADARSVTDDSAQDAQTGRTVGNTAQLIPGTHTVELADGGTVSDVDFGNRELPPGEIRGTLWEDADGDGVQDSGEGTLSGWTVYVDENENGQFDTGEPSTTTDSNGDYIFSGLVPGSYVVAEVLPAGWLQTFPGEGAIVGDLVYVAQRDSENGAGGLIEVFDFSGALIQTIDVPQFDEGVISDIEIGPTGDLFVSLDLSSDGTGGAGQLLRFRPGGTFVEVIPLPADATGGIFVHPFGFDVATDGTFWVSQPNTFSIAHVDARGGVLGVFPVFGIPEDVAIGPDGLVWWVDVSLGQMLNLRDDGNLWIGATAFNVSVLYDRFGNVITTRPGGASAGPVDPQEAPDGSLFVTNFGSATLEKFDPLGTSQFTVPTAGFPVGLAVVGGDVPRSPATGLGADGFVRLDESNELPEVGDLPPEELLSELVLPGTVGASRRTGRASGAALHPDHPDEHPEKGTPLHRLFAVPLDGSNDIVEVDRITGAELNRFAAPELLSGSDGLAFDGTSLFFISTSATLWELDPDTGTVLDSDSISTGSGSLEGLAALGGNVYLVDSLGSAILEFDPVSDSVTDTLLLEDVVLLGGLGATVNPDRLVATANVAGIDASSPIFAGLHPEPAANQTVVLEINPVTGAVISVVPLADAVVGASVIDNEVYLGRSSSGQIDVRTRGGALLRTLNLPYPVSALGADGTTAGGSLLGGVHRIVVDAGESVTNVNFGNAQPAEIHGTVWHDLNGDEVRDAGEPGLEGWTVYLDLNRNRRRDDGEPSTLSDADGAYSFTGLLPGNYSVREVLPEGWSQTFPGGATSGGGGGGPGVIDLVGQWNGVSGVYGDVWAEGNFAYIGHADSIGGVNIVDISDPTNPTLAATFTGSAGGNRLQDLKVENGIGYFASEGGAGTYIVDLSNPASPVELTRISSAQGGHDFVHNLFVDGNFLYLADSRTPDVQVFNVSDPANPVFVRTITSPSQAAVHDITVANGRLYTSVIGGFGSADIFDVSNVAMSAPLLGSFNSGSWNHSNWPTPDGNYLAVARELQGGDVKIWDISDPSNVTLAATIDPQSFGIQAYAPHNPLIAGNFLYVAWYDAGLQVFDISDPTNPVLAGSFDTFPGTASFFDGNWGVYPFLGQDRILLSDIRTGLYIVSVADLVAGGNFNEGALPLQPVDASPAHEDSPPAASTSFLFNPGGFLTGPSTDSAIDVATTYLQGEHGRLGLTHADVTSTNLNDEVHTRHNGADHLYFTQHLNGIEVFGGIVNVTLTSDRRIVSIGNRFVPNLAERANLTEPVLPAEAAVRRAAAELGVRLPGPIFVGEEVPGPVQEVFVQIGANPDQGITAKLMYDVNAAGEVRLVWNFTLGLPEELDIVDINVDAETGEIVRQVSRTRSSISTDAAPPAIAENLISEPVDISWEPRLDPARRSASSAAEPHLKDSALLSSGSYRVFPQPLKHPDDGPRSLIASPADSTASPFGWHDTDGLAGAEFTDTRGNNVFAQEGRGCTIDFFGTLVCDISSQFRPDGGSSLEFDFPLDLGLDPVNYVSSAITNMFYWVNVSHDIHYAYGFDESAGNFQVNNYSNAGLGNDQILGLAQFGAETGWRNNAFFIPTPEGESPLILMFLWDFTPTLRDGDLENTIIIHEFGHGVSTRLTGGASNVWTLTQSQSAGMGEGWSDFWAAALTAEPTDLGTDAVPVGTYVKGEPPDGPGIRQFPYSTDMSINPLTYGALTAMDPRNVHAIGTVWATVLWDLYWGFVDEYGFDPDLIGGNGGNNTVLQLVMDGLKLQPAEPTFLKARDAILLADQLNNGGANEALIWTTFAQRGMGFSARDGGSASSTNVTEAFDVPEGIGGGTGAHGIVVTSGSVEMGIDFGNELIDAGLPPTVVEVLVRGSIWQEYLDHLEASGLGSGGYSIPTGSAAQVAPLPWTNLDQVIIRFSEDVDVQQDDLEVRGVNVGSYSFSGFSYDSGTFTATWTLSAVLATDKLLLDLDGSSATGVVDVDDGLLLDGEFANEADPLPASGDGTEGGDFRFRINVLPGDTNQSTAVNLGDVLPVFFAVPSSIGDPGYSALFDVNGSGSINLGDVLPIFFSVPDSLPEDEPTSPAADGVFEALGMSRSPEAPLTSAPAEAVRLARLRLERMAPVATHAAATLGLGSGALRRGDPAAAFPVDTAAARDRAAPRPSDASGSGGGMGSVPALASSALRDKGEPVAAATRSAADMDDDKSLNASAPVTRGVAVDLAFADFAAEGLTGDPLTDVPRERVDFRRLKV